MKQRKFKSTDTPGTYEDIQDAIDSLVASGHIEQKRDANGQPVHRPNSQGVLQPVWVTTGKPYTEADDTNDVWSL
jgi:hypothetical protein